MERDETFPYKDAYSNLTKVNQGNHQIFDSYYDLINWDIVNVSIAHQTYHKIKNSKDNNEEVLMKFIVNNEVKYDYLVANKYNDGRIVYWQQGIQKKFPKMNKSYLSILLLG